MNLWLLLHRLAANPCPARLSPIYPAEVPGVTGFKGPGAPPSDRLAGLFERRATLTAEVLTLGSRVWTAYASPDPRHPRRAPR